MRTVVRWGDCDEAGIVYYPRYFYWADCAFHERLQSVGLSARLLREKFRAATPLVEATATFRSPLSYDAPLEIVPEVSHWGRSSFRIDYVGKSEDKTIFTAMETRVWLYLGTAPASAAPIAEEFKELMSDGRTDR